MSINPLQPCGRFHPLPLARDLRGRWSDSDFSIPANALLLQDLLARRQRIGQIAGFSLERPDHLTTGLAVHLLPLRQHHFMRHLQAVMARIGGEFDVAEESGHVGGVERGGDFLRLDRICLLDRMLQDLARGIARGGVIVGLGVELVLERPGEFRRGRAELRLVRNLDLSLRGHGYAKRGGTELAEFVVAGRDQDRDPFHIGFLVVHLPRQCGAVGIMTTAEESVGIRGNDLVDDRTEIGGRGRVGFIHHHLQPGCFGLLLGRREHRFRERIVGIDDGDLGVRILRLQRLDRVNAAGGIKAGGKSYKVNFVSYDDQSVGDRVQQLYTRLVNQDRAQFLFSPYSSGLTAPAAIISEQYGKIMVDAGGAEEKPFQLGNKYICSW